MEASSFTDYLSAWSSAATALFTLITVGAAIWAAMTAVKTMKISQDANEQAKRDSIEQTRPYVFAQIVPSLAGIGAYDLLITNGGKSAAINLTFEFDKWEEPEDKVTKKIREMFEYSRTLPPGCSIRTYWRLEDPFDGKEGDATASHDGMPGTGTVTAIYTSSDPSHPHYREEWKVTAHKSGYWPVPQSGSTMNKNDDEGDKQVKVYRLLQNLVLQIGEMNR